MVVFFTTKYCKTLLIKEKTMKVKIDPSKNILVNYTEFDIVQFTKLNCWNDHYK